MSIPHPDIETHCILFDNPGMTMEEFSRYNHEYVSKKPNGSLTRNSDTLPFDPAEAHVVLKVGESEQYDEHVRQSIETHELGLELNYTTLDAPHWTRPNFQVHKTTDFKLGPEKIVRTLVYGDFKSGEVYGHDNTYIKRIIKDWGLRSGTPFMSYIYQDIFPVIETETFKTYDALIDKHPQYETGFRFSVPDKTRTASHSQTQFFQNYSKEGRFYFDDAHLREKGPTSSSIPAHLNPKTNEMIPGGFGPLGWTDFMLSLAFVREGYKEYLGYAPYHIEANGIDESVLTYFKQRGFKIAQGKGVNDPKVQVMREKGIIDATFSEFAKQNKMTHTQLLNMRLTPWLSEHYK